MKILFTFVLLFGTVALIAAEIIRAKVECSKNQTKRIDCNNCICQNGKWVCTVKICSPRQQCISGQHKRMDCNTCQCLNGKWHCTERVCRLRRGVPITADLKNTPCAPNDYFKIDCNTCYCNIDKTGYLCTENLCPFTEPTPTNGSVKGNTETENVTVTTVVNTETTTIVEVTTVNFTTESLDSGDDFSCIPGQTFKKDCNTCTCTQDGKNAICTLKNCTVIQ